MSFLFLQLLFLNITMYELEKNNLKSYKLHYFIIILLSSIRGLLRVVTDITKQNRRPLKLVVLLIDILKYFVGILLELNLSVFFPIYSSLLHVFITYSIKIQGIQFIFRLASYKFVCPCLSTASCWAVAQSPNSCRLIKTVVCLAFGCLRDMYNYSLQCCEIVFKQEI
jgi:hypothetical protein